MLVGHFAHTEVLNPLQALGICGHAPKLPGYTGGYSSTGPFRQITMGYPYQNTLSYSQRGNEGVLLPCAPRVSSPRVASSQRDACVNIIFCKRS